MPELSLAEWFGVAAFFLHLVGYGWYAHGIFHERIRPNAAAWFMWLVGNLVEYLTYNALPGAHWAASALPLACLIGVTAIFVTVICAQARSKNGATYHAPEFQDYFLIMFDVGAGLLWLISGAPHAAHIIAVSTSIATYIPLWRTTWKHPAHEHLGPWVLWCLAYVAMFAAVMIDGGPDVLWRSFYPVYYGILSGVVVALMVPSTRRLIRAAF